MSNTANRVLAPREQAMVSAARRVGLADEPAVIRKALELERLLATRLTAGGTISDTCRNILCLDLAATVLDVPVDKTSIIKHSGLKKSAYASSRGAAEGLLQMRSSVSVGAMCLKMQCISVQPLAEKLLSAFAKTQSVEVMNPQYICMAVHQACRLSKIKLSKTKLQSQSGLRSTQWAKLEGQWTKFVDENFSKNKAISAVTTDSLLAKCVDDIEMTEETKMKEKESEKTESYELWRKRILKEAYCELRALEAKSETADRTETAPRKSPRKREDFEMECSKEKETPRKSPRKKETVDTPKADRSKGVRLLFG